MRPRTLSVIWPTALAAGAETKMLLCVFLKMTFKTKPISEMKGTLLVNKSEVSNCYLGISYLIYKKLEELVTQCVTVHW